MGTQQGCTLAFSKHQHLWRSHPWQQGYVPSSPCPPQRPSLAWSALALRTGHQGSVKRDREASAVQTPTLIDLGAPWGLVYIHAHCPPQAAPTAAHLDNV